MSTSSFSKRHAATRERLVDRLVSKELQLNPGDENFKIASQFALQNLAYGRYKDTSPPEVEHKYRSMEQRLFMNAQLDKGEAFGSLYRFFLGVDLRSDQLECNHRVLDLMFHLAGRPVDTAYTPSAEVAALMARIASESQSRGPILTSLPDPTQQRVPSIDKEELQRELALCASDSDSEFDQGEDESTPAPEAGPSGRAPAPTIAPRSHTRPHPQSFSILTHSDDAPERGISGSGFGLGLGDAQGLSMDSSEAGGGFEAMRRALLSQLEPETSSLPAPPPYLPPPMLSDSAIDVGATYDDTLPTAMIGVPDATDVGPLPTLSDLLITSRAPHLAPLLRPHAGYLLTEDSIARACVTACKGVAVEGVFTWDAQEGRVYVAHATKLHAPNLSQGLTHVFLKTSADVATDRRSIDRFLASHLTSSTSDGSGPHPSPVTRAFCSAAANILLDLDVEVDRLLASPLPLSILQTHQDVAPLASTFRLLADLSRAVDTQSSDAAFIDTLVGETERYRLQLLQDLDSDARVTSNWMTQSPDSTLDFPIDYADSEAQRWRLTDGAFTEALSSRQAVQGRLARHCLLLLVECTLPFLDALTVWLRTGTHASVTQDPPSLPASSLPAFLTPLAALVNDAGRCSHWRLAHLHAHGRPLGDEDEPSLTSLDLSRVFMERLLEVIKVDPPAAMKRQDTSATMDTTPPLPHPTDGALTALDLPQEILTRFPETQRLVQWIERSKAGAQDAHRGSDLDARLAFLSELTAPSPFLTSFHDASPRPIIGQHDATSTLRAALAQHLSSLSHTDVSFMTRLPPIQATLLPHCIIEPTRPILTDYSTRTLALLLHPLPPSTAPSGLAELSSLVSLHCMTHAALYDLPGKLLTAVLSASMRGKAPTAVTAPPPHEVAALMRDCLTTHGDSGASLLHSDCVRMDVVAPSDALWKPSPTDPMAAFDILRIRAQVSPNLQLLLPPGLTTRLDRITAMILRVKAAKTALERVRKWGWIFRRNLSRDDDEGSDTMSIASDAPNQTLARTTSAPRPTSHAARQQAWRDKQMALGHVEASDAVEQELVCLVNALHQFLLGHVLPACWGALQGALHGARTLSDVHVALADYARSLERQCFAADGLEAGWGLLAPHIRTLLAVAVSFAQWKGALLGPHQARSPRDEGPESRAILQAMRTTVQQEMSYVLRVLQMRMEVVGTEGDSLRLLLSALNASGFYVNVYGEIRPRAD